MANTWIYLIKDVAKNFYKIGQSRDPVKRLEQLIKQATLQSTPNEYVLVEAWWADECAEMECHQVFHPQKVRGEWFDLSDADVASLYQQFKAHQPHSTNFNDAFLDGRVQALVGLVAEMRRQIEDLKLEIYRMKGHVTRIENTKDQPTSTRLRRLDELPTLKEHQEKWVKKTDE